MFSGAENHNRHEKAEHQAYQHLHTEMDATECRQLETQTKKQKILGHYLTSTSICMANILILTERRDSLPAWDLAQVSQPITWQNKLRTEAAGPSSEPQHPDCNTSHSHDELE